MDECVPWRNRQVVYARTLAQRHTANMRAIDSNSPVVFLMGPTASGKTEVAAKLYDRLPLELISVDAAQVYRGMNIGTAKPDKDFLLRYPHHLIDICDPPRSYSAADFVNAANKLIVEIHGRGRIPLLVGGTMFYFKALENGLSSLPSADPVIRQQLNAEIEGRGIAAVYRDLVKADPLLANRIKPSDTQRVQRAMEICRISGLPPSGLMEPSSGLNHPIIKLTLFDPDRTQLHKRIEARFTAMIEAGLVDEVTTLLHKYPDAREYPSMRTVGYRQVIEYLDELVNQQQMSAAAMAATRQLAKRQLTWLRQQSGVVWFDAMAAGVSEVVETYLRHCEFSSWINKT